MALLNVADVVQGVAVLLDDPGQTSIDQDYVIPFLNLRWASLTTKLSMLGLQYSEEVVAISVPAGTASLANFMIAGQPLAALMEPISVDWKLVGTEDDTFTPSNASAELSDYADGVEGIPQYSWQGGTLLVVPSSIDVVARVRFNAMATTLTDATDNMIRGVGEILAFRTAELIYAIRGNPAMQKTMKDFGDDSLDDFLSMSVMRGQTILLHVPSSHRRSGSGRAPFVAR